MRNKFLEYYSLEFPISYEAWASIRLFDLQPLERFSGLNLPSKRDVLQRFFYIRDNSISNRKSHSIATKIYEELQAIYAKVPVIMKKKSYCISKIEKLHANWAKLSRTKIGTSKTTIENFMKEIMLRNYKEQ